MLMKALIVAVAMKTPKRIPRGPRGSSTDNMVSAILEAAPTHYNGSRLKTKQNFHI